MARIKNIRQLVWLVSTIKKEGRITLNDLNQKWVDEEIAEAYTDFSLDLRPTADFIGELLRHKQGIEVLEPANLRQRMRDTLQEMLNIY